MPNKNSPYPIPNTLKIHLITEWKQTDPDFDIQK